ncbi:MAG: Bro-N domain-containing protein [Candidatus Azobacteroides sp.]|nr:Bro-N domain-containing protein [Candidatus Azobacteroides sp.]
MRNNENPSTTSVQQSFFFQNSSKIRVVLIDDVPWFALKDVCSVLEHSNHKIVVNMLENDEVRKVYLTDKLDRRQYTWIINESGLYALIMRSNKPQAKIFRKWITSEVLPAIRKTGSYSASKQLESSFLVTFKKRIESSMKNIVKAKESYAESFGVNPKGIATDLIPFTWIDDLSLERNLNNLAAILNNNTIAGYRLFFKLLKSESELKSLKQDMQNIVDMLYEKYKIYPMI